MTLLEFHSHMTAAYIANAGLKFKDAAKHATELLPALGIEFGHPDYDWSRASAIDIADEEMTYWDEETSGANT